MSSNNAVFPQVGTTEYYFPEYQYILYENKQGCNFQTIENTGLNSFGLISVFVGFFIFLNIT